MNRLEFFKKLGVGLGLATVLPQIFIKNEDIYPTTNNTLISSSDVCCLNPQEGSISFYPYKTWYFQTDEDKVYNLYSTVTNKAGCNKTVRLKISGELLSDPAECVKILKSELDYYYGKT